jgi:hypothetical protein
MDDEKRSEILLVCLFLLTSYLSPSDQAARELLTLDPKDAKRMFEGPAILRKMQRYGLIGDEEKELDFVLQLTTPKVQSELLGFVELGRISPLFVMASMQCRHSVSIV